MARTRRTCSNCGNKTYTTGDFCPYCATSLIPIVDPDPTATASAVATQRGGRTMNLLLKILGSILLAVLIIIACSYLFSSCNRNVVSETTPAPATTTAAVPTDTVPATTTIATVPTAAPTSVPTETTIVAPTETVASTSIGIDQPSKSWFIAEPGSMISGDVALFDNDNNSKKLPLYDNDAATADIIIIGDSPVYVWAEWGCHYWAAPTDQDLANKITNKIAEGFTTVRVFSGLTRENYTMTPELHPA